MAADDRPVPDEPYIAASRSLPEITVKAMCLGILLSVVLAGANAYLGLKAGMTVSASIPAAVISMSVLRLFRQRNILENNNVQTAASSGEALAAGAIFTLPALVILGTWTDFAYWPTTIIAALGGLIGVLFTIPLRRALIVDARLAYPEGVATAEVLKAGEEGGGHGLGSLVTGAALGAIFKLGETGLRLWTGTVEGARRVGDSIAYFGMNTSPALLAVGYIVGLNIGILVFLGGAMNWLVAVPIYAQAAGPWPEGASAAEYAATIWSTQTRYIGVGAMVVGGLWALIRLAPNLSRSIRRSMAALAAIRAGRAGDVARTEREIPVNWVGLGLIVSTVPVFFVFRSITGDLPIALVMTIVMLVAGFLFSAVASYMAGLVGSSNNPISGVTIATLLTSALLLLGLGMDSAAGPAAAVVIGAVICCAAAIGGDNMQDLKTGHVVGATPYKQQIMETVGVLAAAVFIAPILSTLLRAYGIADIHVEGQEPLQAPQATLMAAVARGVFAHTLPWPMVGIGAAVAVVVILVDLVLEHARSTFRTPVLAVAVGVYLPFELSVPIALGGLLSWATKRFLGADAARERRGTLMAAGLITGEAILAILIAIPLAAWEGNNRLAEGFARATGIAEALRWPGLVLVGVVLVALARATAPTRA
jgi:putative OPT family oligopeptide transporter